MKGIAAVTRAVLCGALTIGVTMASACSSHERPTEARDFGTVAIPLRTTVGSNTYRLDAVFVISGAQGDITLTTSGDDPVLSTALPTGSYSAFLQSFSLSKDNGTGTFNPVAATVVSSTQPFTVFADSTTTVNFQFETEGTAVSTGSGTVDITFGVTETSGQCAVLGPGCPDGYWCAPPALTGTPAACLPSGTTPIGAACSSPLDCVAPSTCHDFGAGPVCTSLCSPDQFGQPCATGGSCVEADPSYGLCTPETACNPITVDRVARTVQSERFFLDFSNAVATNPEDLDVLRWTGASTSGSAGDFGPNLTQSFALDACSSGIVSFFGNSLIPPDVDRGGKVLVGAGSTGTWEQNGASIVIHSTSSGCAQSVPVPVETRYTFREGVGADTIEVERSFDFGATLLSQPFRPIVPRLDHGNFDQVLHPDATGTGLVTEAVSNCPYGCQPSNWDGSWFAFYASSGSSAGLGMIVRRSPSAVPANLWIDYDAGFADTNSSSLLLSPPAGGFSQQVTEKELFCFFNPQTWTPSLTLPPGCTLDLECKAGTPVVGCDPNPCQHGGTCSETPSGYECSCPPGVNGKNCDVVFTMLSSLDAFVGMCGLRSDQKAMCFGLVPPGITADPPVGTFTTIGAGPDQVCGIDASGGLHCFGSEQNNVKNPPALPFKTVTVAPSGACGVVLDGSIQCWYSPAEPPPPAGSFLTVSRGNAHACAIRNDHTVQCWLFYNSPELDVGQANPPPGEFLSIASGVSATCGLRTDGTLACWGADSSGNPFIPPPGSFVAFDFRGVQGCGIHADQTLECWGTAPLSTPPSGTFRAVAVTDLYPCAVRTDDSVVCWGPFADQTTIPSGQP